MFPANYELEITNNSPYDLQLFISSHNHYKLNLDFFIKQSDEFIAVEVNINKSLSDLIIHAETRRQLYGSANFKISPRSVCQNDVKYQICAIITAGMRSGIDLQKDPLFCSRIYVECPGNGKELYISIRIFCDTQGTGII